MKCSKIILDIFIFKAKFKIEIYKLLYKLYNMDIGYSKSSATFSYGVRISLEREWNTILPKCCVIMNYPSTADCKTDDITIDRIVKILKYNGYGSVIVYNLSDFKDSINIEFDIPVIIAWGNTISNTKTIKIIKNLKNPLCFGHNKNGNPTMPTRLTIKTDLQKF